MMVEMCNHQANFEFFTQFSFTFARLIYLSMISYPKKISHFFSSSRELLCENYTILRIIHSLFLILLSLTIHFMIFFSSFHLQCPDTFDIRAFDGFQLLFIGIYHLFEADLLIEDTYINLLLLFFLLLASFFIQCFLFFFFIFFESLKDFQIIPI